MQTALAQFAVWLERHVDVTALVLSVVLLTVALLVITVLKRVLAVWVARLGGLVHISEATALAVTRTVAGALWLLTALLLLGVWGVGVGGFWTLLVSAVAVIGVGFVANWAMVSNFTASVFIAVWRPFHLDDMVEIIPENLKGRIVARNMMFVVLREESGAEVYIPNNLFFQKMTRVMPAGTMAEAQPSRAMERP